MKIEAIKEDGRKEEHVMKESGDGELIKGATRLGPRLVNRHSISDGWCSLIRYRGAFLFGDEIRDGNGPLLPILMTFTNLNNL